MPSRVRGIHSGAPITRLRARGSRECPYLWRTVLGGGEEAVGPGQMPVDPAEHQLAPWLMGQVQSERNSL